jgi:hypothetical protein
VQAEKIGRGVLEQVDAHRLAHLFRHLGQQLLEVVRLHAAVPHHAADYLVVDAVLGRAGMEREVVVDDGTHLLVEGCCVLVTGDGDPHGGLARPRLAEVDHQVALGDLVGCELVVGLLSSIDVER